MSEQDKPRGEDLGISIKDRVIEAALDPENDGKNKAELAAKLGIDRKTLWRYEKGLDWDWIKQERRRLYAQKIIEIDGALLREAKKGNVRAIEVAYQRFDGWVPTQGMNLKGNAPDAEVAAEMKRIQDALKKSEDGKAEPGALGSGTATA